MFYHHVPKVIHNEFIYRRPWMSTSTSHQDWNLIFRSHHMKQVFDCNRCCCWCVMRWTTDSTISFPYRLHSANCQNVLNILMIVSKNRIQSNLIDFAWELLKFDIFPNCFSVECELWFVGRVTLLLNYSLKTHQGCWQKITYCSTIKLGSGDEEFSDDLILATQNNWRCTQKRSFLFKQYVYMLHIVLDWRCYKTQFNPYKFFFSSLYIRCANELFS